jgi:hypothetical protein
LYTQLGGINLCNVPYVPSLKCNLISIGNLANLRYVVAFSDEKCWVSNNISEKQVLAIRERELSNGLYWINIDDPIVNNIEAECAINLWHGRFGHLNYISLSHMSR